MLTISALMHGPGIDEVGHIASGVCYWQSGNTTLYSVNPPLARMVACFPLFLFGIETRNLIIPEGAFLRSEFEAGQSFWTLHGTHAYTYLSTARMASLVWTLLVCIYIYKWTSELFGSITGSIAVSIWCFCPLVITNAQMITPDVCAAATGLAASYHFRTWLGVQSFSSGVGAGLALGLAMLSKFTWIFLPALWALWVFVPARAKGYALPDRVYRILPFMGVLGLAILVVNVPYQFEGIFRRLDSYQFTSSALGGDFSQFASGNSFSGTSLGNVRLPFPSDYILGLDRQKLDFERRLPSYLRGTWRSEGWWYYYLYGFLVKLPEAYIVLIAIAVCLLPKLVQTRARELLMLLSAPGVLMVLVSSQTGFNHHLRYVLPCLPMLYIWIASSWNLMPTVRGKVTIAALVALGIFTSLYHFPHNHSYFNMLSGGVQHGSFHMLNSNIDWGQDILYLSRWQKSHPELQLDGVGCTLKTLIPLQDIGLPIQDVPAYITTEEYLHKKRLNLSLRDDGPRPGRYAIFVNELNQKEGKYSYFCEFAPFTILGNTVYLYELTDDSVERYWRLKLNKYE